MRKWLFCCWFLAFSVVSLKLGTVVAAPHADETSQTADVAGYIDAIVVGNQPASTVEAGQMAVNTVGAHSHMALHYGDMLSTGPDVSASLRIGHPLQDFTLYPASQIQLVDPHTLRFKLGKLFEQAHDYFLVITDWTSLGVHGTAFQAEASSGGVKVAQLEGELIIGSPGTTTSNQQVLPACRDKLVAPCRLEPLKLLTLTKQQEAVRTYPMGRPECRTIVNAYSDVVIAAKPQFPPESLIPNFESPQARAESFRESRFESFWQPDSKAYFETLGDVYVDWGDGDRALRAYQQAGQGQRQGNDLAIFYDKLANALRLARQLDEAESYYQKALSLNPAFAFPYNGLGEVYRDRALAEIGEGRLEQASPLLEKAGEYYKHSLDRSLWGKEAGRNRAIPLTNLGNLALLDLSVITRTRRQALTAEQLQAVVQEADALFGESLDEYPGYPYAVTGRANAYMASAQIYAAAGQTDKKQVAFASAESTLKGLIDQYPTFAPAYVGLSEVYREQGNTKGFIDQLNRARELDPKPGFQLDYDKVFVYQETGGVHKPG
jgi:tetratricopeptide (TPR) repeat protein